MKRTNDTNAIYRSVTQELVEQIEKGTEPWLTPWLGGDWPRNHRTKRLYTGTLNVLILSCAQSNRSFKTAWWLSQRQAEEMGGSIRDGQKPTVILFGRPGNRFSGGGRRVGGFGRLHPVYNVDQCVGLPPMPRPPMSTVRYCNARFDRFVASTRAAIREGGSHSFYLASEDYIQLPSFELFYDIANWPRTVIHELAHWSGHLSRLNRMLVADNNMQRYAIEEALAEVATAFVCQALGISPTVRSADYLAEWLRVLKVESDYLFDLAPEAGRVADYLLAFDLLP